MSKKCSIPHTCTTNFFVILLYHVIILIELIFYNIYTCTYNMNSTYMYVCYNNIALIQLSNDFYLT